MICNLNKKKTIDNLNSDSGGVCRPPGAWTHPVEPPLLLNVNFLLHILVSVC